MRRNKSIRRQSSIRKQKQIKTQKSKKKSRKSMVKIDGAKKTGINRRF